MKYLARFYFGSYSDPRFATSNVIEFPKAEVSIVAPTGTGKRWVYSLESMVTEDYNGKTLDIPEANYKFVEER